MRDIEIAATNFYSFIAFCWFLFLMAYDSTTGAEGLAWLVCLPINMFLATIWPISMILQWVML